MAIWLLNMGPAQECGWHTQCHSVKVLSLSKQVPIANSFLVTGRTLCPFPFSVLRFSQVWTCAGLCAGITVSVWLCVYQPCCVCRCYKTKCFVCLEFWASASQCSKSYLLTLSSRVKILSCADLFYFCHYKNNNFYGSIKPPEMSSSSRNDCNLKHGADQSLRFLF